MCEQFPQYPLAHDYQELQSLILAAQAVLTASGAHGASKFGSMGVTAKFYSWRPLHEPRSEISRSDQRGGPRPLQIPGTINAYTALMAERVGHQAIYLSGGGVVNASYGLPDLGMTSLNDVLEDVRRITGATDLPLLVDIDTGWGGAFNIAKTVRDMIAAGAAAVHIEDQVSQKRCGHRPNKAIVSVQEMVDRIKAAVDAKTDNDFVVMARTDALSVDGINA